MRRFTGLLFLPLYLLAEDSHLDNVRRIKVEAFQNSRVMEQLSFLTDIYGPRLTGSPEFAEAADWAVGRLKEYGLTNVHTEKWGPFGRSWSLNSYTLEMISPRYSHLSGAPLAWSAPSNGTQTGEVFYAPIEGAANFLDVRKNLEAFKNYEEKWTGKLRGKIVLVSEASPNKPDTRANFRRFTDADLAVMANAPEPAKVPAKLIDDLRIPANLRGESKPDEVVMIGAHFDSWHSGTGATDNGGGSAVMIEVMRVLKAARIKLNRTVRIGLWGGEEQGIFGSKAYVKGHFGPEKNQFSGYLNLDNGSGKIRGVYLQQNDAARPLFEAALQPFRDMGVTTVTLCNTSGTDHLSFDASGLPGFQFIQDPLDYDTITHHSAADTYSHAVPEDLMQATAVIASLVSDFANQEHLFPRKP